MRPVVSASALLLMAFAGNAGAQVPQVGDVYEIRTDRESTQHGNDGSSGSSTDRDTIIVRVIALRDGGQELEYDLPKTASGQDRARAWQFPAHIFKPNYGPMQLLNGPAMETRVSRWLKGGKLTRAACGHWIFTWNAFRIECDPQSIIKTLERLEAWPSDLREGALYQEAGKGEPVPLIAKPTESTIATYVAETPIDPDDVRRERAEADLIVAEISGKALTLDAALRARSAERISGKVTVTFGTDPKIGMRRRTKVTSLEIKGPGERVETQTVTETLERRLVSRGN